MGRMSANLKVVPGGPSSARRGMPDRNVVPWKEMERRVAERIAAKAARGSGRSDIPPWKQNASETDPYDSGETESHAPDSGIRTSQPNLGGGELTFAVYSVEELDARQRLSAPPPSIPPPPPSRWPDAWRSLKALMLACMAWYRIPKPRSRLRDVCGEPFAELRGHVYAAIEQLPWRKILVRSGIGLGTFLLLSFVVLTAAELTDDLKPGASRSVGLATKVEAPKAEEASPAAALSAEGPTIELEDPATPAAAKKAGAAAKKPGPGKKKKKGADVFAP